MNRGRATKAASGGGALRFAVGAIFAAAVAAILAAGLSACGNKLPLRLPDDGAAATAHHRGK